MSERDRQPERKNRIPNYLIGAWVLDGPRGGWLSSDRKSTLEEEKRFRAALDSIDVASSQSLGDEPTEDYTRRFQAALDSFDEIAPPEIS